MGNKTNFQAWIEEALQQGAGRAHRWCDAPNRPRLAALTTAGEADPTKAAEEARTYWMTR